MWMSAASGRFPKGTPMPPARLLRLSEHGAVSVSRPRLRPIGPVPDMLAGDPRHGPRGAAQRQHGPRLVHGGVPDVEDEVGRRGRDDDRARVASLLEADSRVTETAGGI